MIVYLEPPLGARTVLVVERKLAAFVAADVASCSRLMGADEEAHGRVNPSHPCCRRRQPFARTNPMTSLITHHRGMLAAGVLATALSTAAPAAQAQSEGVAASANGETAMVIDFEVKPGSEAEFEEYFLRSARCSRLEPGNVAFNIHRVVGQEQRYLLYEIWRSPEALNAHFERPYTKALFSMFDRALAGPPADRELRDISPATRSAPVNGDPTEVAECR
jgi:quinol monooxygenase YgiN